RFRNHRRSLMIFIFFFTILIDFFPLCVLFYGLIAPTMNNSDMMPIEESINSSMTDLVTIFDTNDIDKVIALAEAQSEKSLYHIALWAKMSMLKAALTMDAIWSPQRKRPKNVLNYAINFERRNSKKSPIC
ncbi:hypothetical protein SSS_03420, partial [Sarcoptes scabiei]